MTWAPKFLPTTQFHPLPFLSIQLFRYRDKILYCLSYFKLSLKPLAIKSFTFSMSGASMSVAFIFTQNLFSPCPAISFIFNLKKYKLSFHHNQISITSNIHSNQLMNQQIIDRTNQKIQQNQKADIHQWQYNANGTLRKYIVFKNVFSPAIFIGTQFLTQKVVQICSPQDSFLQIGCGCGVTSIQIAITHKCKVVACDINKEAVLNARSNMNSSGIQIQIVHSDMFDNIPEIKFDVIYWNFPFHPSQQIQNMAMLERAVRDPGYKILRLFLSKAKNFLNTPGKLLLGFSLIMGDFQRLKELSILLGWQLKVLQQANEGGICLIQLK